MLDRFARAAAAIGGFFLAGFGVWAVLVLAASTKVSLHGRPTTFICCTTSALSRSASARPSFWPCFGRMRCSWLWLRPESARWFTLWSTLLTGTGAVRPPTRRLCLCWPSYSSSEPCHVGEFLLRR